MFRKDLLPLVFIALLTFLVYAQSLANNFVNFDDPLLVYENPAVLELTTWSLKEIFTSYDPELYVPLTFLTYQIEHYFFGLNPFVFHLTNVLLHIGNALLVYWLALLLKGRKDLAVFVSVLFAVHPLHTEAVAWIAARKDVLSSFFFLLSFCLFLHSEKTRGRSSYFWSVVFFALALLSKVTVVLFPLVLVVLHWRERQPWTRTSLFRLVPFFLLSGVFGVIALVGKYGQMELSTRLEKILMAGKSVMFYLQKLLVPTQLSVLYPYKGEIVLSSPDFFVPALLVIILTILILLTILRTRQIAFAGAFFLLMLAPSFVNFQKSGGYYFASDRYAYIPSIALFFIIGLGIFMLKDRFIRSKSPAAYGLAIIVGCVVLIFAGLTHARSLVWADSESLNRDILARYPTAAVASYNLGYFYDERGDDERAIPLYLKTLEYLPGHERALISLGIIYAEQHTYDLSVIQKFQDVLRIIPDSAKAHHNMGVVYQKNGMMDKAIEEYLLALDINPSYAESRHALAEAYGAKNMYKEAVEQYLYLLKDAPRYARKVGLKIPEGYDAEHNIH